MKTIVLFIIISLTGSCITDGEFDKTYKYKIVNNTNKEITIRSFSKIDNNLNKSFNLTSNDSLKLITKGHNSMGRVSIVDHVLDSDSIQIIYENSYIAFKCTPENPMGCNEECSPFNSTRVGDTFVYTIEQICFDSATPCTSGVCD